MNSSVNTEKCATCGVSYPSAGDGYCELCPTCADREEQGKVMNRRKHEAMVKLEDLIADLCRLHSIPLEALWLIFEDESHDDIQAAIHRLIDQKRVCVGLGGRLLKVR